jgi:hypothetical protein
MAVVTSASDLQSKTEPEAKEGVEAHTHTGMISDEEELFALKVKGEGRNNPDGINEDEAAPEPEAEPVSSKWAWAAGGILLTLCVVLLSGGGTYAYSVVASKTQKSQECGCSSIDRR